MLSDILERMFSLLEATFINIPVDNFQGALYVVLNFLLLLFAAFTGTGTTGT